MIDKPSINFVHNLYSYTNIRIFKFKYLKSISILISFSKGFKNKYLVTMNTDFFFKNFYINLLPLLAALVAVFFLV